MNLINMKQEEVELLARISQKGITRVSRSPGLIKKMSTQTHNVNTVDPIKKKLWQFHV